MAKGRGMQVLTDFLKDLVVVLLSGTYGLLYSAKAYKNQVQI